VTLKPADDGDGIVVRVHDLDGIDRTLGLDFIAAEPASACRVTPIEDDGEPLELRGRTVGVPLGGRAVTSLRVRFGR
jgi:hypothetical protein